MPRTNGPQFFALTTNTMHKGPQPKMANAVEGIPAFQQNPSSPVTLFIPFGTVTRPPHPYKLMSPAFILRFILAAGAGLIALELISSETVAKKQGPNFSHTEPPAKRRRYFEPEDSDSDSESGEVSS